MAPVTWLIRAYDLEGNPLSIPDMLGVSADSEQVRYCSQRVLSQPVNGIEQLSGRILLVDPAAGLINKKTTVLKMWRTINDPIRGIIKPYVAATPDFAGPVIATNVSASSGYKSFIAVNPLWRMQERFHVLNHHLQDDTVLSPDYPSPHQLTCNGDNLPFDASALMYRMIALLSARSTPFQRTDLCIRRPPTKDYTGTPGAFVGTGAGADYWPKTIQVAPYFIAKGTMGWDEMFQDIMQRVSHPDLHPEYIHVNGDRKLMYFKTAVVRGTDKSGTVHFDFHTGSFNLADIDVDETLTPGSYGNFVWVIGDGGPNVYAALALDVASEMAYGSAMILDTVSGGIKTDLDPVAPAELAVGKQGDAPTFQLTLLPEDVGSFYYGVDYDLGDIITVNATKGYWSISGYKQRIYQADLNMDDDNVETPQLLVSNDYLGKIVAPTTPTAMLTAAFTNSPTTGTHPVSVVFTDTSTPGPSGPITAWAWDFGDGGTSTLQNPTHNFASAGFWMVTLVVTGTGPDGTSTTIGLVAVL
jgi:hypothetical protein